jgi:phospholipase C
VSWRGYTGRSQYPLDFYTQLKGSPNIVLTAQFAADARAGNLPQLSYIWHDSPLDEHPPADVTLGHNAVWQAVDAVVQAGAWSDCVFMLTWDDWGGYDDHVATPNLEVTPDGVQVAYGPRVPLLMFGGPVQQGIDSRWCSHVSVPRTAMQLLGLPALGVPRLDDDAGLADLVVTSHTNPPPPAFGTTITQPPVPRPTPHVHPLPPVPVANPSPIGRVILRGGKTLPPPNDAPLPTRPAASAIGGVGSGAIRFEDTRSTVTPEHSSRVCHGD